MFFDGSATSTGSGGGWVLYGADDAIHGHPDDWTRLAALSFSMPASATVTAAEMEACLWGVVYVASWLQNPQTAHTNVKNWRVLDTDRFEMLESAGFSKLSVYKTFYLSNLPAANHDICKRCFCSFYTLEIQRSILTVMQLNK